MYIECNCVGMGNSRKPFVHGERGSEIWNFGRKYLIKSFANENFGLCNRLWCFVL